MQRLLLALFLPLFWAPVLSADPMPLRTDCQNLIQNGSFEQPGYAPGQWRQPVDIPGWTRTRGTRLEIQNHIMGPASSGQQYIELASDGPTTIRQSIPTQSGADYLLRLAYSPRPGYADSRVRVLWGGELVITLDRDGGSNDRTVWEEHTIPLAGYGDLGELEIADDSGADAGGGFLDDVRICHVPCRNAVRNGSFESPQIPRGYRHLGAIPYWSLSAGEQFEIQRDIMGPASDGSQYLELASRAPIGISQDVATAPENLYLLRLDYSPRPGRADNEAHVVWDHQPVGTLSGTGVGFSETHWQTHRFVVAATSTQSLLEITDRSRPDNAAGFVDDVRVCLLPIPFDDP